MNAVEAELEEAPRESTTPRSEVAEEAVTDEVAASVEDDGGGFQADGGNKVHTWQEELVLERLEELRKQVKNMGREDTVEVAGDVFPEWWDLGKIISPREMRGLQWADKHCAKIMRTIERSDLQPHERERYSGYVMRNDLLYRIRGRPVTFYDGREWLQLMVPDAQHLRLTIMTTFHTSLKGGHGGAARTLDRIKASYYWPKVAQDVVQFCRRCTTCSITKDVKRRFGHFLRPLVATRVGEVVALDLWKPGKFARTSRQGNV